MAKDKDKNSSRTQIIIALIGLVGVLGAAWIAKSGANSPKPDPTPTPNVIITPTPTPVVIYTPTPKPAIVHTATPKPKTIRDTSVLAPPHVSGTVGGKATGIFEGTWELISSTIDGATQTVKPTHVTFTQDGPVVHMGNQHLQVTSDGTVTYKEFAAHDAQQGHKVPSEDQADLTVTFTWKVEGSTLVFETVSDYKTANYRHPPGKVVRIMLYRRVSP